MTWLEAKQETMVWLKRFGVGSKLGIQSVNVLMNEALANTIFPLARMHQPEWFTVSQVPAISANADGTGRFYYPINYVETLALECTDANCTSGYAMEKTNREWTNCVNSTTNAPNAANPIYIKEWDAFRMSPSRNVVHHHIAFVPYIDDDTLELTTVIPWIWEDMLILHTATLARQRIGEVAPNPEQFALGLQLHEAAMQATHQSLAPLQLFRNQVAQPSFVQKEV